MPVFHVAKPPARSESPATRHREDEPPGSIAAQGCDRQTTRAKACRKACASKDCKDLAPKASAPEHLRPPCGGGVPKAEVACRSHPHLRRARMHATRTQPDEMSLADQQPRRQGLLLLRKRASQRATLLSGTRADCISVGRSRRSAAQQGGCVTIPPQPASR